MHTNTTYTNIVEWPYYQSKTEPSTFSEPTTTTGQKIIFESSIL